MEKQWPLVSHRPSSFILPILPSKRQSEKIVILLGVTGSGKSSFVKAVTKQDDIVVGHGMCSCMCSPDQGEPSRLPMWLIFNSHRNSEGLSHDREFYPIHSG
jgi:hypothetical protein